MGRKSEKKKMERRIIISGVEYQIKRIRFNSFEGRENGFQIQLAIYPRKKWKFVLYDKDIQQAVSLNQVEYNGKYIVVRNYHEAVMAGDVRGIHRYTFMALDEDRKIAVVFGFSKRIDSDDYDKMSEMLFSERMGTNDDHCYTEGIFYLGYYEKIIRLVIRSESLHLNDFLAAKVTDLQLKGDFLSLQFAVKDYGYEPVDVCIQYRNPIEQIRYYFNLQTEKADGVYSGRAEIHLKDLKLAQFYWDIKGTAVKDDHEYELKLENRDLWMHRMMYLKQMHYLYADGNIVYPYKTKSNEFALQFRPKTKEDSWFFIMKEYAALAIYYLMRPVWKKKNIWLVYEKYCVMAQDNGFYFFKYCMENLPESEKDRIYYVIDKKAPDYQYVRQYGRHVLNFLSLKHMVYLMGARVLISSDTKAHAYAWHSPNSIYRNMLKRKENVFLQHGVIAFKCCHQGLRKKSVNASNLFVVSSDVEKKIILDNFGYDDSEVIVTGLARWDVLEDKSVGQEREILLMPTWRTWLEEVSEETFKESDYYKHYMSLLNHPKLLAILKKYKISLNFYIHPKFREYISTFKTDGRYIRLIPFGSEPLNELIMRCSMMITDYSSAVWDVFYQGKPVVFYLFDLEQYNKVQGSYIDMEKDAFGDVVHTPEKLASVIEEYTVRGFEEKKQYGDMRSELIKYIDDKNSERTYNEIIRRYP